MSQQLAVAGVALLAILVVLTTAILLRLRRPVSEDVQHEIQVAMDEATERFGEAVRHHVEVNAVLALTEQLKGNPKLTEALVGYSREVAAAAMMCRVNSLGAQIKVFEDELKKQRYGLAQNPHFMTSYVTPIDTLTSNLTSLREELLEANRLVEEFIGAPAS